MGIEKSKLQILGIRFVIYDFLFDICVKSSIQEKSAIIRNFHENEKIFPKFKCSIYLFNIHFTI